MFRKVLQANFKSALRGLCVQQVQNLHMTGRTDNVLIIGGAAAVAGALVVRYGLSAYNSMPIAESPANDGPTVDGGQTTANEPKPAESSMFSSWFAKNYYEGGFEDKMTKREAALILGVRESATAERIKDAHRRILLLNHPDRGGSAFVAAKINEAKDLLIKGK